MWILNEIQEPGKSHVRGEFGQLSNVVQCSKQDLSRTAVNLSSSTCYSLAEALSTLEEFTRARTNLPYSTNKIYFESTHQRLVRCQAGNHCRKLSPKFTGDGVQLCPLSLLAHCCLSAFCQAARNISFPLSTTTLTFLILQALIWIVENEPNMSI